MKKILRIAHKGGGYGVGENRMASIKKSALNPKIDAIEIDLRLTKDGLLVAHHDRGVYINGKRIWIDRLKYEEIKHFDVPLFGEVMKICESHGKILNIDIKDERCVLPLSNFFKKNKNTTSLLIDCFSLDILLELQEDIPEATYSLSHNPKDSFDFSRRFVFRVFTLLLTIFFTQLIVYFLKKKFRKVNIDGISVHSKFATESFIADLQAFGFKVYVYGVETKAEFARLSRMNVDGIKTQNVAIFS